MTVARTVRGTRPELLVSRPRVRRVQRPRSLGARPRRHPVAVGHRPHPARHPPRGAALLAPGRLPPLGRLSRTLVEIGGALAGWLVFEWRRPSSRAGISRRLRVRVRAARLDLHQARPDRLRRRGALPRGAGRRVQAAPRPGAARVVRRRAARSSRSTSAARSRRCSSRFDETPIAAASIAQVHAAPPAHRRRGGGQGPAAARRRRSSATTSPPLAWLAPRLVGRIPVAALANPPALVELFAETIVEELDFRLEAENMLDIARVLAQTGERGTIVPRPHPTLVTAPRAGDGAARRLRRSTTSSRCTRPASTPTRCCRPG